MRLAPETSLRREAKIIGAVILNVDSRHQA